MTAQLLLCRLFFMVASLPSNNGSGQVQPTHHPSYGTEHAPSLDELFLSFVRELSRGSEGHELEELITMLKRCPINRLAVNFKALRAKVAFGLYHHSSTKLYRTPKGQTTLQDWVRGNFESMRGSFPDVMEKMLKQAYGLGYSVAEFSLTSRMPGFGRQWRIKKINVLDPRRYTFAGRDGEWDRIIYRPLSGKPRAIPRWKLLHIYCPSIEDPENPLGDPDSERAYPFWQFRLSTYKAWGVAQKRTASGLLLVKADSNETTTLLGKDGQPQRNPDGSPKKTNAVHALVEEAQKIEEGSVFGTDKKNDVQFFQMGAGGGNNSDYRTAADNAKEQIFLSYGIPWTIFNEGSATLGQAGLNAGHRLVLDTQIEAMIDHARDEVLEKLIRLLLFLNFGVETLDDLGEFKSQAFITPEMAATRASTLMSAIAQGIFDSTDLEAHNRLREDCSLTPVSRENFDAQLLAKLMQQQSAESPYPPEEPPEA